MHIDKNEQWYSALQEHGEVLIGPLMK